MRRALLLVLLGLAGLAAAPAAAPAAAIRVGIADQKADMFGDPWFKRLGVQHARIYVPWDVFNYEDQAAELDRWMAAAYRAGVDPLVSFGHSRVHRRLLPSPERFKYEFRRFRQRYPWVRTFATWNEANHCGEPTCNRIRLVAAYYKKLRQQCRRCTILAVELLDQPNMVRWTKTFRRYAGHEPRRWAIHNYVEANRFRSDRLRQLLRNVKGDVWITETGGIVKRRRKIRSTVRRIPESAAHAARVMRYLLDRVPRVSGRIKRIYLYHWNTTSRRDTWDSALIGNDGRRRSAYRVLANRLDSDGRLLSARRR